MSLRIVIVTYNWPPRNAIGTHRPYSWAKYWSRAGAKVTVLTARKQSFDLPLDLELPELPGVKVIEADFDISVAASSARLGGRHWEKGLTWLKRAKRVCEGWFGIALDARDGWVKGAMPHALQLAEDADVVVSTYGPRGCHLIASAMKRHRPKLFWVADYRDLWSQNHLSGYNSRARKKEAAMEREHVGTRADMLTVVSEDLANQLRFFLKKPTYVIYNGFDVEDAVELLAPASSDVKRIVYTGLLYPGSRDPTPLFSAMRELQLEGRLNPSDLQVDFYGPASDWLQNLISQFGLSEFVKVHGRVLRNIALTRQCQADRLLLLESGATEAKGVLTGKLFEYLAAGRPIISLGSSPDSAIATVLEDCASGICIGTDVKSARQLIEELLAGDVPEWFRPDTNRITTFSRENQANILKDLIITSMESRQSSQDLSG